MSPNRDNVKPKKITPYQLIYINIFTQTYYEIFKHL